MAKKPTKKKAGTERSSDVAAAEELAASAKKSIVQPDQDGGIDDVAAVKKLHDARDGRVRRQHVAIGRQIQPRRVVRWPIDEIGRIPLE